MSRTITIPSSTTTEAIGLINETPNVCVSFLVGKVDEHGQFLIGQQFENFVVRGNDYTELNGPPPSWAPDKPTGTYRNEDLWHYVDLKRNSNA